MKLALALPPLLVTSARSECFTNNGLDAAVDDVGEAEKTHGPIADWDVS